MAKKKAKEKSKAQVLIAGGAIIIQIFASHEIIFCHRGHRGHRVFF